MRNLQLRKGWTLPPGPPEQALTASAWDGDSIICAYGPSKENPLLELRRWQPKQQVSASPADDSTIITSFDALSPSPDLEFDKILCMYFLPESSTACLVLAGGDIIIVRENPLAGEEKIEIVGSVETGLTAAEWSPDGELLVLATKADTLLFMTRDFDNSVSSTFTEDDLRASKHVSVGWGKKETQFTGKGARALRDPTMPEKVDEGVKSAFDDDSTTISWRGDGQYLAVNSRQASGRRVIRVYSREGALDGVSEPVDNLEAALSWRPAGNIIASLQRRDDQLEVIFFERNGLRHGEFKLRNALRPDGGLGYTSCLSLTWNCDSSILAVCFADRVQLWTMSNYHYYLKQEIFTSGQSSLKPSIIWNPENSMKCILQHGILSQTLQYEQVVSRSSTWNSNTGTVAVIDGSILKLTSLRYANVPPPMAQEEIVLDECIISVAISTIETEERIAILTSRDIYLYLWKPQPKAYQAPEMIFSRSLQNNDMAQNFRSVIFESKDVLIILRDQNHKTTIQSISIPEVGSFQSRGLASEGHSISTICALSNAEGDSVLGITYTGELKLWKTSIESLALKVPSAIGNIQVVDISQCAPNTRRSLSKEANHTTSLQDNLVVFGLTRGGALYANNRCLTRDCTSFVVTSAHLVFTTSKHFLKFAHLKDVDDLIIPSDTPELDERCRSVERGAKLVTVIQSTAAVILQMPRGNLETIFPRALVLAEIRVDIDNKKYKKAFMTCRKQRVDMNILYDYKPKMLLSNIDFFVDQISKVEYIDLFLSQLRDEDVSLTMYKDTLAQVEELDIGQSSRVNGKINKICDAFLPSLRSRASTNMQNIITAHVVKNPPDIDAGLLEVAKFQLRGEKDAERAVEHICFLVDVNRLYESALGLYDLDLTLLIAGKAQKDPREYIPFLQRLQALPLHRRKFEIDDYLFRHAKALESLWELEDFEEYKKYVVKHELYEVALKACRYQEIKYRDIMALYADFLRRRTKHQEAGIAFEYIHDFASASESYRLAYMWRESLTSACMGAFDAQKLQSLATTMCDALVEHKDYFAAATVTREFLKDTEKAARLLCRGYLFGDATMLLGAQGLHNMIPEIVDGGLKECMGATTELLADCRSQLKAQVPRIRELRTKKAEEPLAYYDGAAEGGTEIPDNISLAATDASTTGGSLFTRYTGKQSGTVGTNATRQTAKKARKEERKRAKGKKGSVYEEEYLVNSVGRLIERVNSVGEEVQRLVVGLIRRGMKEQAFAVNATMAELVEECAGCRDEVFELKTQIQDANPKGSEQARGAPAGHVDSTDAAEEQQEPKKEPPTVRKWEGITLFGR